MYVPLDQLPATARVWVYQADRRLTPAEANLTAAHLRAFCETWAAHGIELTTSFELLESRFVVLAVNEERALPSGCSIDASVAALRALGGALGDEGKGVDFLDKSLIIYQTTAAETATVARADLRAAVADGRLTPTTPVFDTLVPTLGALRTAWRKPAAETWLARYFATEKNVR